MDEEFPKKIVLASTETEWKKVFSIRREALKYSFLALFLIADHSQLLSLDTSGCEKTPCA